MPFLTSHFFKEILITGLFLLSPFLYILAVPDSFGKLVWMNGLSGIIYSIQGIFSEEISNEQIGFLLIPMIITHYALIRIIIVTIYGDDIYSIFNIICILIVANILFISLPVYYMHMNYDFF